MDGCKTVKHAAGQGLGLGVKMKKTLSAILQSRRPPWAVQLSKYIIVLHKEEQHQEKIQPVSFLSGKLSLRIEMEINTVAWTSEMMTQLSCFSVKLARYLHSAYCKTGCGWESSRGRGMGRNSLCTQLWSSPGVCTNSFLPSQTGDQPELIIEASLTSRGERWCLEELSTLLTCHIG